MTSSRSMRPTRSSRREGLRTPFIRVAKDGAIIDASRFTGAGGVGATVGDQVVDDRIMDLFVAGHTLVLQALHRLWPPLVEFAGALSERARAPRPDQRVHHPEAVSGVLGPLRRPRRVRAPDRGHQALDHPRPRPPGPTPEPALDAAPQGRRGAGGRGSERRLRPREGDVLYLPRGFIHSAEALGGVSVHLTIGIHSHTRHDLVRSLLELAEEDPRLRRSLPLGVDIGDPESAEHGSRIDGDRSRGAAPVGLGRRRRAGHGATRSRKQSSGSARAARAGAGAGTAERRHAVSAQVSAAGHDP